MYGPDRSIGRQRRTIRRNARPIRNSACFYPTNTQIETVEYYGSLPECSLAGRFHGHSSLPTRWGRQRLNTPEGAKWLEVGPRGKTKLSEVGEEFATRTIQRAISHMVADLGLRAGGSVGGETVDIDDPEEIDDDLPSNSDGWDSEL